MERGRGVRPGGLHIGLWVIVSNMGSPMPMSMPMPYSGSQIHVCRISSSWAHFPLLLLLSTEAYLLEPFTFCTLRLLDLLRRVFFLSLRLHYKYFTFYLNGYFLSWSCSWSYSRNCWNGDDAFYLYRDDVCAAYMYQLEFTFHYLLKKTSNSGVCFCSDRLSQGNCFS